MKLKASLEIGKECGLETVGESLLNIQIHSNMFVDFREEVRELQKDYEYHVNTYGINEESKVEDVLQLLKETHPINALEIHTMLTLSTGHLSKKTGDLLDEDCQVISYKKDGYGWLVCVTDWKDSLEYNEKFPDDLRKCLEFAEKNGCDWICLDCDGPLVDELKVYEWK